MKKPFLNSSISTEIASRYLINFVYESTEPGKLENFTACSDVNASGLSRFHPSVLAETTLGFDSQGYLTHPNQIFNPNNKPDKYVIASGVRHHPDNWTTPTGKKNLFEWLSPDYLQDLQQGNAILLLDQCLEGYHTNYLWQWFHESFDRYSIPPQAVVYITGDWNTEHSYNDWCNQHSILNRMLSVPYAHFEIFIKDIVDNQQLYADWETNLAYKKQNTIKTYNCLQKRLRTHRIWFFGELYRAGLLDCGLVSMNDYGTHIQSMSGKPADNTLLQQARAILPLEIYGKSNTQFDDRYYIDRVLDTVYKDTWVSVVSEPIFADEDNAVFISEKTFKSIACMHPFIIVGSKNSLRALHDMGYKTFDGFINEDYDTLSTHDRIDAIIKEIARIDSIEDKLTWFEGMRDVLEYNYNLFHAKKNTRPTASVKLVNYCKEYFNV